ncbi:MAG: DUF5317 domain-containing protein [Mycobacteriales bacterium]
MTLVVIVLLGAMALGKLRGGSLRRLSMLRLPRTDLVIAAGILAVFGAFGGLLGLPARPTYVLCTALSAWLACLFVFANRHVVGVPLVAAGFFLNAVVIVANGAMPVSQRAADFADVDTGAAADGTDAKHVIASPDSTLMPLADVIPLRIPRPVDRLSNVYSFGDVVLAAGLGLLVMAAMERPGAGRRARQVARGRLDAIDVTDSVIDLRDVPRPDAGVDATSATAEPELKAPSSSPAPW